MANELLDAALEYHSAGQPVVAVGRDKAPYREGWNRYFKEKQTEDEVRQEFANGAYGLARVLFPGCRFLALDYDGPHAAEAWAKTNILLPPTARIETRSGGFHLIFTQSKKLIQAAIVKRNIGLVTADCACTKDDKAHPCHVDFLINGIEVIPPTTGYREDPDFPLECAVEIPDEVIELAIKHSQEKEKNGNGGKSSDGKIRAGERNVTLTSIAGVLRRQGMGFDAIFAALRQHNHEKCEPPLDDAEVEKIARSVSRYDAGVVVVQNLTELGNCKRFTALHAENVFYSAERRKWILWNGRHWEWDVHGKVHDLAENVLAMICNEAAQAKEKEAREALLKHALKTEARRQIEAMLALAEKQPEIRTGLGRFDRDPMLFNAANLTIDLRNGTARPFKRDDYITHVSPTVYDPQAPCPLFDAFMKAITLKRSDLAEFIQRASGYAMTGATKEQCIFILSGPGGNGKSTFAMTLTGVLGNGYTQQIKAEVLCQSRFDGSADYHIAELVGVRVALACETELRRRLASALIKQWTGGEPLVGRRPYEMPIRFTPIAKLFFSTNHLPKIDDTTTSIWRRIYRIPFNAKFTDESREKGYEEKLLPESSGILNWLIRGCLDWQRQELSPPKIVKDQTAEYQTEEDLVQTFIADKCVIGDDKQWVAFAELYAAYVEWCNAEGEAALTATALGRALSEKGFEPDTFNHIRGRKGLRLRRIEDKDE
jgi:putative DNA primase/helicase